MNKPNVNVFNEIIVSEALAKKLFFFENMTPEVSLNILTNLNQFSIHSQK